MRRLLVCSVTILIALLGAGCVAPAVIPTPTATPRPATPTPTRTPTPSPTPSPTATPTVVANIVIAFPAPYAEVSSPLRVTGRARVFEAVLQVRLKDAAGKELVRKTVMASCGAPEYCDFAAELSFAPPATAQTGRLEAYSLSPRDGSEINLVSILVQLKPK